MAITYITDMSGVDWDAVQGVLIEDDFHNERSPQQYRQSFENSALAVIAYHDENVVGTARVLSDGVCNAYIVDVWTHSAYRRQGIGRRMMTMLEDAVRGQHISLWTSEADDFYEALGYVRTNHVLYEKVVGEWLQGM